MSACVLCQGRGVVQARPVLRQKDRRKPSKAAALAILTGCPLCASLSGELQRRLETVAGR